MKNGAPIVPVQTPANEPLLGARLVLGPGANVLVLSENPQKNFPEFWGNPRVLFWTNKQVLSKSALPPNTVAAFHTRFVDHEALRKVKGFCIDVGALFWTETQSTGSMKRVLRQLMRDQVKAPAPADPNKEAQKARVAVMSLDIDADPAAESKRIWDELIVGHVIISRVDYAKIFNQVRARRLREREDERERERQILAAEEAKAQEVVTEMPPQQEQVPTSLVEEPEPVFASCTVLAPLAILSQLPAEDPISMLTGSGIFLGSGPHCTPSFGALGHSPPTSPVHTPAPTEEAIEVLRQEAERYEKLARALRQIIGQFAKG